MSTLNEKIAAHLDEHYPPEFDEKWVNKLLTDREDKTIENKVKTAVIDQERALITDIVRIESELRKQRIAKKVKLVDARRAKPTSSSQNPDSMTAIEKQKQTFEIHNKKQIKIPKKPELKKQSRGILSRITGR